MNCIRALGGYTHADSVQTLFDTDTFVESKYLEQIHESSGNLSLSLNWYFNFYSLFSLTLSMHHLGMIHLRCVLLQDIKSAQEVKYFCLKVVSYFSLGYVKEAASLGFSIYRTRDTHPK